MSRCDVRACCSCSLCKTETYTYSSATYQICSWVLIHLFSIEIHSHPPYSNNMMTERERQAENATSVYTYECNDGEIFSAAARSESGAWRVLNAERPGMLARFIRAEGIRR